MGEKVFVISPQLASALIAYLSRQAYVDVYQFINALQSLTPIDLPKPAKPEDPPKEKE